MAQSLTLSTIMIGTMQPTALTQFYEKVFDREPDWQDGGWSGWDAGGVHLTIGEHSEMGGSAKDPGRVLFNLDTQDVKGEFARMKREGAHVVQEPYEMEGMWIATLADPDGNYFQFTSPWEDMNKGEKHE